MFLKSIKSSDFGEVLIVRAPPPIVVIPQQTNSPPSSSPSLTTKSQQEKELDMPQENIAEVVQLQPAPLEANAKEIEDEVEENIETIGVEKPAPSIVEPMTKAVVNLPPPIIEIKPAHLPPPVKSIPINPKRTVIHCGTLIDGISNNSKSK
jgi:hypothetical protein